MFPCVSDTPKCDCRGLSELVSVGEACLGSGELPSALLQLSEDGFVAQEADSRLHLGHSGSQPDR